MIVMKRCILTLLNLIATVSLAVDIGSDTAVTRFNTQQTLNNGDRIAGFAALEGGFVLSGINTTGTFDSFFQVSGGVGLQAGTLVLNRDLILHNNTEVTSFGDIVAQGHLLEFTCSNTEVPTTGGDEAGCIIFLNTQELTVVDKDIFSLDWSVADTFLAVGITAAGGTANTVEIWEWDGVSSLVYKSGARPNSKDAESVRWHPTKNWLAIATANNSGGDEVYIYSVDWTTGAFTLLSAADLGGDARSAAWHPTGNYLAVGGSTNTQEVRVYPVSSTGILGTPVIVGSGNVDVSRNDGCDWDVTGSYLAVAFEQSVPNPELVVYEFNDQPTLSLTTAATVNIATSIRAIDWNPTYTQYLAAGLEGNVSITTEVLEFDPDAGTLTVVSEVTNLNKTTLTLDWTPSGNCIGIGTDSPNDDEIRSIYFNEVDQSVTQVSAFDTGSSVRAVRWSRETNSVAIGGDDNIIYIYTQVFAGANPDDPDGPGAVSRCFTWSDICVSLNNNLSLNERCILFSGQCSFDGRGHTLTVTPGARIFVDTNSSLCLTNLTIEGVADRNIGFFDSTSTITLQNVNFILDNDYTVTKGHFDIFSDFNVQGNGHKFTYQSEVPTTIQDYGRMILDHNTTFSYDPVVANTNLLQLTTKNSQFVLRNSTLHASSNMQLLTGRFITERRSSLTTGSDSSVIFGDGVSSSNNLWIEIAAGATLDLVDGCVIYNDA